MDDMNNAVQLEYHVPVAALKNYIRRVIRESNVSCPFVFSDVDKGSAIQTDEKGNRLLIIGLKPVYDHSVQKFILFSSDVPMGVFGKDVLEGMKFENPNKGLVCKFARDDDAVWAIKSCLHELEHLRQQVILCPSKEVNRDVNDVRICVDTMLSEVMPEYYHGSYHLMAHELDAEMKSVLACRLDLVKHRGELGLPSGVIDSLLLYRIEREPQWYGEQYAPDSLIKDDGPAKKNGKGQENLARVRMFNSISEACNTLLDSDRLNRLTTGLNTSPKYRKPGDLFSRMDANDVRLYAFCSTRDDQRKYLMRQMIKHDMLPMFNGKYVAGFSMWPSVAQHAYDYRMEQQRRRFVNMAETTFGQTGKPPVELDEVKDGSPLIHI